MIAKWSLGEVESRKNSGSIPRVIYTENMWSPDLLVYFGSYDGNARGTATVRALDCNALFMSSDAATWYLQPFAHGKTPEAVAARLDMFIDSRPHIKNVVYAGFSMGAFGALLYPTWAKRVDKIVASSPQTRFPNFKVAKEIPVINPAFEKYASIRDLWTEHGSPNAQILLQACERTLDTEGYHDYDECKELADFPNVTIKAHDCAGHGAISKSLLGDLDAYNNLFLFR